MLQFKAPRVVWEGSLKQELRSIHPQLWLRLAANSFFPHYKAAQQVLKYNIKALVCQLLCGLLEPTSVSSRQGIFFRDKTSLAFSLLPAKFVHFLGTRSSNFLIAPLITSCSDSSFVFGQFFPSSSLSFYECPWGWKAAARSLLMSNFFLSLFLDSGLQRQFLSSLPEELGP
jgi:hypothetical protein